MGNTPNWNIYYAENGAPADARTESATQAGTVETALDSVGGDIVSVNNFGIRYFANASARDLALTSPSVGWLTQLDSEEFIRRWDGAKWIPFGATEYPVAPTISGAGASLSSTGLVVLTGSTGVSMNGLSGYRKLSLDIDITATGSGGSMEMWLRTASADDTGANYDLRVISAATVDPAPVSTTEAQTEWGAIIFGTTMFTAQIDLYGLSDSAVTRGNVTTTSYFASAAPQGIFGNLSHRATTAYDGITIKPTSGTLTGTVRVSVSD